MKKVLGIILVLFVFSCSTSDNGNGKSTTIVVPLAPSGLIGNVISPTQINLSWTDNSTSETGFKIERRTGTGNYTIVGTVNADVLTFSDSGLIPSTIYTYRLYSYNAVGNSLNYSNELTLTTNAVITLPILSTTSVSAITQTTATSGGTISSDGGASVTARGVCWGTIANPTISLTTKTTNGSGTGVFTSSLTGLTANTIYYARAYATNSIGTAYGNEISFTSLQNSTSINIPGPNMTDIEGNIYQSVNNCGITFSMKNLNVSKYSDGTNIPQVTDQKAWDSLTTGAWCYYLNTTSNGTTYGKLYNWYAVAGIYDAASEINPALRKKLAPTGWHIPSDSEWLQLTDCLGGAALAGGKMKAITGWTMYNVATNNSGFTGLPGGYRGDSFYGYNGDAFCCYNDGGYWWSLSEDGINNAFERNLIYSNEKVLRNSSRKKIGFSVRCVKD